MAETRYEIEWFDKGEWREWVDAHDDDAEARERLDYWRAEYPHYKFRLVQKTTTTTEVIDDETFAINERVYVTWPEGTQREGTRCPVVHVVSDDGGEFVETTGGPFMRTRLRLDRRGRTLPVYEEVPRG